MPFNWDNELTKAVSQSKIFADSKSFVDIIPLQDLDKILEQYLLQQSEASFDLKSFLSDYFVVDVVETEELFTIDRLPIINHIDSLWVSLTRQTNESIGSLIGLPKKYVVPGGRFKEVYYWDSYFTMLGLKVSGKVDIIEEMVENFSFLIDSFGFIPNGNRTYYLSRSQPPFFSLMVQLLADIKGEDILNKYLPQLKKEYLYWMSGAELLTENNPAKNRVVLLKDGEILNRYFDTEASPRPESYKEDVELASNSERKAEEIYRELRAGAASGWDYSSRWFKDGEIFESIHTTEIIPVDLNCLMYNLERLLADIYTRLSDDTNAKTFIELANKRSNAIEKYCWVHSKGFYFDFDWKQQIPKDSMTLAALFPLFFKIAHEKFVEEMLPIIQNKFLKDGGLVSTLSTTSQQWDAPNGWAPLQWIAVVGLANYGKTEQAATIASRWQALVSQVFDRNGKLMEKYNVVDTSLEAGGGEYPGQDGFGWTNGVFLALAEKYPSSYKVGSKI